MRTEIPWLDDHIYLQEFSHKSVAAIFCLMLIAVIACQEKPETLPILSTIEATAADITSTSAVLKGDIKSPGNMKIVEYGIEISKSMFFSTSETKACTAPAVAGIFQVEFTGLDPNMLLNIFGPLMGFSLKFVSRNIGYPLKFDNSRSKNESGISYKKINQTFDLFQPKPITELHKEHIMGYVVIPVKKITQVIKIIQISGTV